MTLRARFSLASRLEVSLETDVEPKESVLRGVSRSRCPCPGWEPWVGQEAGSCVRQAEFCAASRAEARVSSCLRRLAVAEVRDVSIPPVAISTMSFC